jgi:hypothetical protein
MERIGKVLAPPLSFVPLLARPNYIIRRAEPPSPNHVRTFIGVEIMTLFACATCISAEARFGPQSAKLHRQLRRQMHVQGD